LNIQICVEKNVNPIIEACLRANKYEKINEVLQSAGLDKTPKSTL
jgi:hypothetical protein